MLDIRSPLFTTPELCRIAGVDPQLVKVWLQRGLLEPDRADQLAVRKRPLFSVMGVFRACLARQLGDRIEIGPLDVRGVQSAKKTASPGTIKEIAASTGDTAEALRRLHGEGRKTQKPRPKPLVCVVADEGWTWAVARSVERGMPLPLLAGVAKKSGYWSFHIALDPVELGKRFGPDDSYVVIPIGAMFARVYSQCKATFEDSVAGKRRHTRA